MGGSIGEMIALAHGIETEHGPARTAVGIEDTTTWTRRVAVRVT